MNVNPELEEKRQQINRLIDEIARLSESQLGPAEYSGEFLQRLLTALAAPAGVMWSRTPQGNWQLLYQINFNEIGLDRIPNARACHDELIRYMVQQGRPMLVPPNSGPVASSDATNAPSNLTQYNLLLAPVVVDRQVIGLIEVWIEGSRNAQALRGFMQFMEDMTAYVAGYFRNHQLRQMMGQQQVWSQVETFSRQIHASLQPKEVGYLIVNEARRLLQVDRVSVAGRLGGYTEIEAISGADVIEKRSSLVQCMQKLFSAVIEWNDKLVYAGTRDESLPPKVLHALDAYLTESNSKLLVLLPLRDERETDKERPCRSAMLVECFEPSFTVDQLMARVDVIAKHAAPAMFNSLEHRRIPFRRVLQPLADIRDLLRGKRLAWAGAIAAALAVLVLLLILVPYPLRMYAKGKLVPKERQTIYAPIDGQVVQVMVDHGKTVNRDQELVELRDAEMIQKLDQLSRERAFSMKNIARIREQLNMEGLNRAEQDNLRLDLIKEEFNLDKANAEMKILLDLVGGDPRRAKIRSPLAGTVTTFDLTDLKGRNVRKGDKLLQIARLDGGWEIELHIPEGHVGHVREALATFYPQPLEVDIQLTSHPGKRYKGLLRKEGLGGSVEVHNNEAVLTARVEIGPELAEMLKQLGGGAMPNETEVTAKIRCGNRAVGYVFFYQLWEFFFEHILF